MNRTLCLALVLLLSISVFSATFIVYCDTDDFVLLEGDYVDLYMPEENMGINFLQVLTDFDAPKVCDIGYEMLHEIVGPIPAPYQDVKLTITAEGYDGEENKPPYAAHSGNPIVVVYDRLSTKNYILSYTPEDGSNSLPAFGLYFHEMWHDYSTADFGNLFPLYQYEEGFAIFMSNFITIQIIDGAQNYGLDQFNVDKMHSNSEWSLSLERNLDPETADFETQAKIFVSAFLHEVAGDYGDYGRAMLTSFFRLVREGHELFDIQSEVEANSLFIAMIDAATGSDYRSLFDYYTFEYNEALYTSYKEILLPLALELTLNNVQTWCWTDDTEINAIALGDVDLDGDVEIVTGGTYSDGSHNWAQLCVWDGASLTPENVQTWQWDLNTVVNSIALGDVDADGHLEIVTGGTYSDDSHYRAQLCVWDANSLTLKNVKIWDWPGITVIKSVALGDVDLDGDVEIVTGGHCSTAFAQLCVWDGASLTLEEVQTWQWNSWTYIESVALGDVDLDGDVEIVTSGWYWNEENYVTAQLCVWDGASLTPENVQTWQWGLHTQSYSVVLGDINGNGDIEIVTGGDYYDGFVGVAQLCVWDGASLALENVRNWVWEGYTQIQSVVLGDVNGNGDIEIVTGGYCPFGAQLCVWDGTSPTLEKVQTWIWGAATYLAGIAWGDVDGDSDAEIVTGGYYYDGTCYVAQLSVWE